MRPILAQPKPTTFELRTNAPGCRLPDWNNLLNEVAFETMVRKPGSFRNWARAEVQRTPRAPWC